MTQRLEVMNDIYNEKWGTELENYKDSIDIDNFVEKWHEDYT